MVSLQSAGEDYGIAEKWKICGTKGHDISRISGNFTDDRKDGFTDRANDGYGGSGYAESAGKERFSSGSGSDLSGRDMEVTLQERHFHCREIMDTRWETDEREKGKNEERNKEILSGMERKAKIKTKDLFRQLAKRRGEYLFVPFGRDAARWRWHLLFRCFFWQSVRF